mgnify:CR=1 FL=1
MQDTIKTYKPKKSKKIVRRKGGKAVGGLTSALLGGGSGVAYREVPDFWPEGTSLPVQIGAETAGAYVGANVLKNIGQKVAPKILKGAARGLPFGGIVPSIFAGAFTAGSLIPELAPLFPRISGSDAWKKHTLPDGTQQFKTISEYQKALINAVPALGKGVWEALGERYREVQKKAPEEKKRKQEKWKKAQSKYTRSMTSIDKSGSKLVAKGYKNG